MYKLAVGCFGASPQLLGIDSGVQSGLIEAGKSEMGTADARCHLMACCANGEGEVEAGDDDRPLVLRAGEMDEEQLCRRGTLICWRAG
jgi:hypothetical protein